MCIEKAMGIEVSERVQYIRTIMDELQRIDSHLLFYSCLAMVPMITSASISAMPSRSLAEYLEMMV